jgi:hypothetical protein
MPKQAQKNGQDLTPPTIQVTFDYSAFEFFDSNREPTHWEKVAQSISERNLSKFNPIMVVERGNYYAIIDGQNRYMACKSLGLPIYFIDATNQMKEHDMAMLNSNQKNWKIGDYIRHFANVKGGIFEQIYSLVPSDLYSAVPDFAIYKSGSMADGWGGAYQRFKTGKSIGFNFKLMTDCINVYNAIEAVRPSLANRSSVVRAYYKLWEQTNRRNKDNQISHDMMLRQIESYPSKLYKCRSYTECKDMLRNLYNYNKREANRI